MAIYKAQGFNIASRLLSNQFLALFITIRILFGFPVASQLVRIASRRFTALRAALNRRAAIDLQ